MDFWIPNFLYPFSPYINTLASVSVSHTYMILIIEKWWVMGGTDEMVEDGTRGYYEGAYQFIWFQIFVPTPECVLFSRDMISIIFLYFLSVLLIPFRSFTWPFRRNWQTWGGGSRRMWSDSGVIDSIIDGWKWNYFLWVPPKRPRKPIGTSNVMAPVSYDVICPLSRWNYHSNPLISFSLAT